jgi:transcriptional regulator with XRE-family HTH domain
MLDPKTLITKRIGAGLTQKQLAGQFGISPRTLLNWETGATSPTAGFWPKLAAFLAPTAQREPQLPHRSAVETTPGCPC